MASITATCSMAVTVAEAGQKAAWTPATSAYAALLPQSPRHGEAMGTGVFGAQRAEVFAAGVIADAKPNARTGRLPRDRQPA